MLRRGQQITQRNYGESKKQLSKDCKGKKKRGERLVDSFLTGGRMGLLPTHLLREKKNTTLNRRAGDGRIAIKPVERSARQVPQKERG